MYSEHKITKKADNQKKISTLFIRVEERLNTRKALEKENVCTFAKYILPKDKKNI